MIGLYIFSGVVLLFVMLLSVSITATIVYESETEEKDGTADYKITYGIFRIFPPKKKKKDKNKDKKDKAKKKRVNLSKSGSEEKLSHMTAEKSDVKVEKSDKKVKESEKKAEKSDKKVKESEKKAEKSDRKAEEEEKNRGKREKFDIETIKALIISALKPFGGIFGSARIKSLYIHCIAGGEDAAKVALNYGTYCAAVYGVTAWLKVKRGTGVKEIKVVADFDRLESYVYMRMKLKLTLGHAIFHFLWFIKEFAQNRKASKKSHIKGKEK